MPLTWRDTTLAQLSGGNPVHVGKVIGVDGLHDFPLCLARVTYVG